VLMHDRLVNEREPIQPAVGRLGLGSSGEAAKLRRVVSAFLRSQANLPQVADLALTADATSSSDESNTARVPPPIQGALLDP
jgi:hypothetical protein